MGFKFKDRKLKILFNTFNQRHIQTCSALDCLSNCTIQCLQACPYYCLPNEPPFNFSFPPPPPSKTLSRQAGVTLAFLAFIFLAFGLHTVHRKYHRRHRTIRLLLQRAEPSQPKQGQLEEPEQGQLEESEQGDNEENPEAVGVHLAWMIETIGLPQGIIDKITVFKYGKNQGLVEGTHCSVCLREFDEDDILKLLPTCDHAFHTHCIGTWLRSHTNCPLCRAMIVLDPNRGFESHVETPGIPEDLYQIVSEEEGVNRDGGESPGHQLHSASTTMARQELPDSSKDL